MNAWMWRTCTVGRINQCLAYVMRYCEDGHRREKHEGTPRIDLQWRTIRKGNRPKKASTHHLSKIFEMTLFT
ncbi:hypothetical protein MRX96_029033 [Rhipicephalus microplus]